MYYPKHQIRSYCLYLGSLIYNDHKLDMGVYEHPDGCVSHAIVFGEKDHEYMSGEIDFENDKGMFFWINRLLYADHLKRK